MVEDLKKHFTSGGLLIALLIVAVGIYLFQTVWQVFGIFSDVFVVMICAWVVSFILEPAVEGLTTYVKLPRLLAALIIYTISFGLLAFAIILFIPAFTQQVAVLGKTLPKYVETSPDFIHRLTDTGYTYLQDSIPIIPSVASFLFSVFIILIISFYLVVDKETIQKEFYMLIPRRWHPHARFTQELIDTTFGSFLRVQLLVGIIAGVATWVVLQMIGNQFALATAVLSALLTMIPFAGPVLGIIPPVAIAFLADPARGLFVFIVLLIVQQIIFNIIAPKLLGNALKLHPIVVILSFILGYKLFGPLGAVLGVPVLGILAVILHRLSNHFIFLQRE
ncbi:MAG TPA: AI-2E family transporter [Patescibacteria group bacterium]|nr:AI-2E family transporter [Patescibacteria group bacterium]